MRDLYCFTLGVLKDKVMTTLVIVRIYMKSHAL